MSAPSGSAVADPVAGGTSSAYGHALKELRFEYANMQMKMRKLETSLEIFRSARLYHERRLNDVLQRAKAQRGMLTEEQQDAKGTKEQQKSKGTRKRELAARSDGSDVMDTDVDSSAVAGMTSDVGQVKGDGQKQEESEQETGGREGWAEAESVRRKWQFLNWDEDSRIGRQ